MNVLTAKYLSIVFWGVTFAGLLLVPQVAAALVVEYEETPLFSDMNILPGDSLTRTVVVTNDSNGTQPVYATVENTFNDGLGDVMELAVSNGVITMFSGTFSEFFATTPIMLGQLPVGDSETYYFSASLATSTGNEYQKVSFGFDLIVGFTERLDDGEPYSPTNADRGARGGTRRDQILTVFGETLLGTGTSTAIITWNTDRSATAYLVCGNVTDGPFSPLDLDDPRFGYTFSVPEAWPLNVVHRATLTDLSDGEYECRPASRRTPSSNFTVGDPVTFTIGMGAAIAQQLDEDGVGETVETTLLAAVIEVAEDLIDALRDRIRSFRGR